MHAATGGEAREFDYSGIDPGIRDFVRVLREAGVETTESCEGGKGHAFPEPTIRFTGGDYSEGFRALAVAIQAQLPIAQLRRVWSMQDGEPTGPEWEMVFISALPENKREWWA